MHFLVLVRCEQDLQRKEAPKTGYEISERAATSRRRQKVLALLVVIVGALLIVPAPANTCCVSLSRFSLSVCRSLCAALSASLSASLCASLCAYVLHMYSPEQVRRQGWKPLISALQAKLKGTPALGS